MLTSIFQRAILAFSFFLTSAVGCPLYEDLPLPRDDGNSLARRWYTAEVDDGPPTTWPTTWPQGTLPYCWANDAAESALETLVKTAWNRWQATGVSYKYDMGEYNSCPPVDASGERPKSSTSVYLLIQYNTGGVLRTSVGQGLYPAGGGPFMNLDPNTAIGMGDNVGNIAHEIGHAWGFFHEHQRPDFWAPPIALAAGTVDQINFFCANLKGFAQVPVASVGAACSSYNAARAVGFVGAIEYLPFTSQGADHMASGTFDWASIMLYGSTIGATASTNAYTRKSDGAVISPNTFPSQRDVQRFKQMYPNPSPNPNPCLISRGCSKWNARFKALAAACNIGSS